MMIRWGERGLRRSCTGTRLMRTVKRRTAEDEEEEDEEEDEDEEDEEEEEKEVE